MKISSRNFSGKVSKLTVSRLFAEAIQLVLRKDYWPEMSDWGDTWQTCGELSLFGKGCYQK
jgi:hypothetical protein